MSDSEQSSRRRLFWFTALFLLCSLIAVVAGIVLFARQAQNVPFDSEVWKVAVENNPQDGTARRQMIDSLLASNKLLDLSQSKVIQLLGRPERTSESGAAFNYYLGNERGYISIDSEWLRLEFDAEGRVSDIRIAVD